MDRAFGSFEECVQDGVMSACGAYGTAPLDRIYRCIEQRMEKYFDEGKTMPSYFHDYLELISSPLLTRSHVPRFGFRKLVTLWPWLRKGIGNLMCEGHCSHQLDLALKKRNTVTGLNSLSLTSIRTGFYTLLRFVERSRIPCCKSVSTKRNQSVWKRN